MNIGPTFSDPVARQLYAEIASIEEQHVTQYGSIIDPNETWLERWLLSEANEVWNYYSCVETETNPRIRAIWERFLNYELGHLELVRNLFEKYEKRDAAEILPQTLPEPIAYQSQRDFVRETLKQEVDLRTSGTDFVSKPHETDESLEYRAQMNRQGSPSETVATGYCWRPGTELNRAKKAA
jgi:hypothetical protein